MARSVIGLRASPSGGLRHRRRSRAAPELVADVRDVAVHRVRAQDQLLGDLLIAQPVAISASTALSAGEQRRRAPRPGGPEPREPAPSTARARRSPIASPGEMGVAVERNQRRPRYGAARLPTETVRNGAVATAMHHQRRCMYVLQLCSDVVAVGELQQRGRGLRARRYALMARQPLLLGTVGLTQEDVGQHATQVPSANGRWQRPTAGPPEW